MITVLIKAVDGSTEIYEIDKFKFSTKKDLHPGILEATAYSASGKKLKKIKRHFQKFYIKFKYKPEQVELKPAEEETTPPQQ